MFSDALIQWVREYLCNNHHCIPCTGDFSLHFKFFGQGNSTMQQTFRFIKETLAQQQEFPTYILIHVGSNELARPENTVWDILATLQLQVKDLMLDILENGPYFQNTERFGGVIWSDMLPRPHWPGFTSQKAVECHRRCLNHVAGNELVCTSLWRLMHESFHTKFRMDYQVHSSLLSDTGNHKFYSEIEQFMQTLIRAKQNSTC